MPRSLGLALLLASLGCEADPGAAPPTAQPIVEGPRGRDDGAPDDGAPDEPEALRDRVAALEAQLAACGCGPREPAGEAEARPLAPLPLGVDAPDTLRADRAESARTEAEPPPAGTQPEAVEPRRAERARTAEAERARSRARARERRGSELEIPAIFEAPFDLLAP